MIPTLQEHICLTHTQTTAISKEKTTAPSVSPIYTPYLCTGSSTISKVNPGKVQAPETDRTYENQLQQLKAQRSETVFSKEKKNKKKIETWKQ